MPERDYKKLWEQLKLVLACGPKKRYTNTTILQVITNLELRQLGQEVNPVHVPKT